MYFLCVVCIVFMTFTVLASLLTHEISDESSPRQEALVQGFSDEVFYCEQFYFMQHNTLPYTLCMIFSLSSCC